MTGSTKRATPRRRATVMILVIALLGILFVVGVAFLKTVDYSTRNIEKEQQQRVTQSVIDVISQRVGTVMRDRFVDEAGIPYRSSLEQQDVALVRPYDRTPGNPNDPPSHFELISPTYGQMLGIDGTVSELEPNCFETDRDECGDTMLFGFRYPSAFGNVFFHDAARLAEPDSFNPDDPNVANNDFQRRIYTGGDANHNQQLEDRYGDDVAVDADGDAIRDSVQFDLEWIGLAEGQLLSLREQINPAFNPRGKLSLGLRVVDHGGMVNLNSAHKVMIQTILSDDPYDLSNDLQKLTPPYDPQIEEALLRHRHMLAPRTIAPSRLHGNPYLDGPGECGGADLCLLLAQEVPGDQTPPWWHWWPLAHDEPFDPDNEDAGTKWYRRMMRGGYPQFFGQYDRRHVLTTTSHDDLFMRGGWTDWYTDLNNDGSPGGPNESPANPALKRRDRLEDWVERMLDLINNTNNDYVVSKVPDGFQYPFYPTFSTQRVNGVDQFFEQELDGRLQLSLPEIESNPALLNRNTVDFMAANRQTPGVERAIGLIQSAFTMLLLNARGEEWVPEVNGVATTQYRHIARTAAALTANLIDFADSNDIPTHVYVRGADPGSPNFGRILSPVETAYGIERQPFITEIAAITVGPDGGDADPASSAWAVELFNPYMTAINVSDFALYLEQNGSGYPPSAPTDAVRFHQLTGGNIGPRGYAVAFTDETLSDELANQIDGRAVKIDIQFTAGPGNFPFNRNGVVYLLRRGADNAWHPIDQFNIDGDTIGDPTPLGNRFSMERTLITPLQWTFTVPVAEQHPIDNNMSLGKVNDVRSRNADIRPVEVVLANTGRLTAEYTANPVLPAAFPTTGSLLLLMRHANMISSNNPADSRAFTVPLVQDPAHVTSIVEPYKTIDNGRMPVFDNYVANVDNGAYKFRHHVDPSTPLLTNKPSDVSINRLPGGMQSLPWGQLVFDYFTALPLSLAAPDVSADGVERPKIDEDGKRVHGRINLQTAPWSVIAGIPMMSGNALPDGYRDRVSAIAGLDAGKMTPIGPYLARAIVAYREGRELKIYNQGVGTGNYGSASERSLTTMGGVRSRPGSGFMTVGELANVRRIDAEADIDQNRPWLSNYRMDAGVVYRTMDVGEFPWEHYSSEVHESYVDPNSYPQEDYIEAVARLVAMSDWVTTRSHVFTVYGVIRGQDVSGEAYEDHAIRFQETIDRLPTAGLESKLPKRIGQRVESAYKDAYHH